MKISKIITASFSPTYSTSRCLKEISQAFSINNTELDLCKESVDELSVGSDELLIIGVPVYSGRVPAIATERILKLKGDNSPAIIAVTYGNRHFDDAILELNNLITNQGFKVIAATTIVTQHSIVNDIGKGRPDVADIIFLNDFTEKAIERISNIEDISTIDTLNLPGNTPHRPHKAIPFVPHSTSHCNQCMKCANNCPVGAISKSAPEYTNKETCIRCMRCIMVCQSNSRKLYWFEKFLAKRAIIKKCLERKEPQMWVVV